MPASEANGERIRDRDACLTHMETSAIRYRVADFLKQHPPFHAMIEVDLIDLAARGRVRFYEPHEYLLWKGEPHRAHVFVIQQGTVTLWDESDERTELRDVRGVGDMLGLERYADAAACLHTARAESDVVIYAFPASDFETLLGKYPHARPFVAAQAGGVASYQSAEDGSDPQRLFLHDLVGAAPAPWCSADDSIQEAARRMRHAAADAIAVVDAAHRPRAVLTAQRLLQWLTDGDGDRRQMIGSLAHDAPTAVGPKTTVTETIAALGAADAGGVVLTEDGTLGSRLITIVTRRHLEPVFGDQPTSILRDIAAARDTPGLRRLVHRSRAFALRHLTGAASVDWLTRVITAVDDGVVRRAISIAGGQDVDGCWCLADASGRGEELTRLAALPMLVAGPRSDPAAVRDLHGRVLHLLTECDYLPHGDAPFPPEFYAAGVDEWTERFRAWISDPVREHMYKARSLFDLRAIDGRSSLWEEIAGAVRGAVDHDFLYILANDCLGRLPPLTFFHDAVVDDTGEHASIFRLDASALRPLVDVGRVFGIAAGQALGTSTLERFEAARAFVPGHEAIFRHAAGALRIILWQRGRVGIAQGTSGNELPPALLSRHDRHLLKSTFPSILRLLEFAGDPAWLEAR